MVYRRGNPNGALVAISAEVLSGMISTVLAGRPAPTALSPELLNYMIDLETIMVQQLQRLVEIAEKLGIPEITLPPEVLLKFPQAIITVPPDPEMLASASMIKAEVGRMFIPTWRTALACPAGVTTILPFNVPPGWVTYRRRPVEISSDFYDPNIGINIYSDNVLINPTAPMPLTGAFAVDMGEYVTQWTRLVMEVINGTVVNAVVSFQVCTYLMDRSYWDEFIVPLIDAVRIRVEEILK